jgi:hypothetical protein
VTKLPHLLSTPTINGPQQAALSVLAWWRGRHIEACKSLEPENPAELKPALIFSALYAVVLLAVAFVKDRFGEAGLYPVAVLSGLTDVDAITLSTLNLANEGRLEAEVTARLILLAVLPNRNTHLQGGVCHRAGRAGAAHTHRLLLWPGAGRRRGDPAAVKVRVGASDGLPAVTRALSPLNVTALTPGSTMLCMGRGWEAADSEQARLTHLDTRSLLGAWLGGSIP